jgi:hypothetical protein
VRGCEGRAWTIGVELVVAECWRSRAPGAFELRESVGAGTVAVLGYSWSCERRSGKFSWLWGFSRVRASVGSGELGWAMAAHFVERGL